MLKRILIFSAFALLYLLLAPVAGDAQQRVISGTVRDTAGGPLPGATLAIQHTDAAVISEEDGSFSLNVPAGGTTLVVSFVGMETKEIPLDGSTVFNVVLTRRQEALSKLVVVGYGSVRRKDMTGAIATVSGDELLRGDPTNIVAGLQGKVAGVNVTHNDGAPGAGLTVQIRGTNSFLGGTQPLYVIDGIPLSTDNASATPSSVESGDRQTINALSFLNPEDIASIDILKDASATAIYGSRGANGVILITTKKGKTGTDKVELDVDYAVTRVARKIKMLDAYHYASMQNEAYANSNKFEGTSYSLPFPGAMVAASVPDSFYYAKGPNDFIGNSTDWQDEIFQTALTQNYTLSVSGGSDKGNYLVSGRYLSQNGIIRSSFYRQYTIHTNLQRYVKKWLTIGSNTSFSRGNNKMVKTNTEDLFSEAGVVRAALAFYPTSPLRDSTLHDFTRASGVSNPYVYTRDVLNQINSEQVFSSNYLEVTLYQGLKFRQNIGLSYYDGKRDQYFPRTVYEGMEDLGLAYKSDNNWQSVTSESLLSYSKRFGRHSVDATAGFTYENSVGKSTSMKASNFVNDLLQNNNMAGGQVYSQPQSAKSENSLASFLGRINYGFADKYLFTASLRTDGSSKFAKNNKWAYFPSAAFAWRLSSESFMKRLTFLNDAKIRLSYGRTGNQGIGAYQSLDKLVPYSYPFDGSLYTGYADDVYAGPANDNLKWETTSQYNAGLDATLFKSRLTFHFDVYYKKTVDLLQNITIPGSTGFTTQLVNTGSIRNKGMEVSVNAVAVNGRAFKWDVTGNISFNRNKILDLGGLSRQFASRLDANNDQPFIEQVGYPIGMLYGYEEEGIYRNEAEVRADPVYANQSDAIIKRTVGEIRYKDRNGDGAITDTDRVFIGNVNPKFTYGLVNNFSYKRFTLSIFIQGVEGGDIVNMNNLYLANIGAFNNITREMYDGRWTTENWENAKWPKPEEQYWRSFRFTKRWIEDGSYIRLKSLSLGYDVKLNSPFVSSLHIYVNATNVFTITGYSGYDPDVNGYGADPSRRGVDLGGYPSSRVINFGVKCVF
jgi:TonB-linked SusC/RagA family outer membrane protein